MSIGRDTLFTLADQVWEAIQNERTAPMLAFAQMERVYKHDRDRQARGIPTCCPHPHE